LRLGYDDFIVNDNHNHIELTNPSTIKHKVYMKSVVADGIYQVD